MAKVGTDTSSTKTLALKKNSFTGGTIRRGNRYWHNTRVRTHPHENEGLSLGLLRLGKVEVHLVAVKVGVVGRADAFVEAERPVGFHYRLATSSQRERGSDRT